MLKINDERKTETVRFDSLDRGDVFIDPEHNEYDVCIKIDDDLENENNSYSFDHRIPFHKNINDQVIPVHEAILTIR